MTPVDFVVATRLLVEVVKACVAPPNDRTRVAVKVMMQQRMTGGYGWYVAWAATLLDMAGMQGLRDVIQTSGGAVGEATEPPGDWQAPQKDDSRQRR